MGRARTYQAHRALTSSVRRDEDRRDLDLPSPSPARPRVLALQALALVLACVALYAGTLQVPFLLDDPVPAQPLDYSTRPLVWATFDLNRAWSGAAPWSYHVVNVAVHAACALLWLAVLRRALALAWPSLTAPRSDDLAFLAALLWTVHPLQTGAVTYLSQRAESLAALFALLTVLGFLQVVRAPRSRSGWSAALLGTVLGFLTKETAAMVPPILLVLELALVRARPREVARQRGAFHLTLWIVSALCVARFVWPMVFSERSSAGLGASHLVTPLEYLRSQPGVLLHYLRLCVWPHPLVFDYGWKVAEGARAIVPQTLAVVALLLTTAVLLVRRHPAGAALAAALLYLAPTTSLVPIRDLAFEHRMYLPLAPLLALALAGLATRLPARVLTGLTLAAAVALGLATVQRNREYRDAESLWRTVVERAPENPRGHNNLAALYIDQDRLDEAEALLQRALELKPRYGKAFDNLAVIAAARGRLGQALEWFARASEVEESARVHGHMARLLELDGRAAEAEEHHARALELEPRDGRVHLAHGQFLARAGRHAEARAAFERARTLDPHGREALRELERLPAPR